MSRPKFRHIATIKKRELRALGLAPLSERVVVTARIQTKIAGRGITLSQVRRVIERWHYQRRAPEEKDARSVERYAKLEEGWYTVVIYVPTRQDSIQFNQVATCHREHEVTIQKLVEARALKQRKKEDRA